jgi:hypothetical protein
MGDLDDTTIVQELTSLLDSALRMGEVNGGAEWSNALLFDDFLRLKKKDGSSSRSSSSDTSTTVENMSSEDATKWRFDTAKRLGTVSIVSFVLLIFCRHMMKMMWVLCIPILITQEKKSLTTPCRVCIITCFVNG